jgi:hypothetical protein
VTEAVRKRGDSAFEFSKDPFDSIPISVAAHLKWEAGSLECSLEMLGATDEKRGSFDIVFLAEFAEEHLGDCGRGRREQPHVEQLICLRTSGGVQPVLLVVDPNHGLVESGLIRSLARVGL